MSTDFGQWDRVASELRACRDAQREAWGDVDNATLGRYLAGDMTAQERRRIDKELQNRPELRKLTDLVSDVLRDCEPLSTPASTRPSVLPFSAAKSAAKATLGRWRQWAAVAAAACLLLALGYTVLPTGVVPSSPFRGGLANVTPASGAFTRTAAFHPTFTPGDSALDNHGQFFAKGNDRTTEKQSSTIQHVAVVLADGCAEAADAYHKHGDLDMAEFSYKLAYNIRDWKYGSIAEPTVETRRNLGDVYQTALNLNEGVAATQVVGAPAVAGGLGDKMTPQQFYVSAAQLRKRIAEQPVRVVRKSVVPILVENLNEAKTPEAREQLGRALAELGPAAKDAVPALAACLQNDDLTPKGRAAVREAKERLENAAWPKGVETTPADATPPR